jgi:hypothetical protein
VSEDWPQPPLTRPRRRRRRCGSTTTNSLRVLTGLAGPVFYTLLLSVLVGLYSQLLVVCARRDYCWRCFFGARRRRRDAAADDAAHTHHPPPQKKHKPKK